MSLLAGETPTGVEEVLEWADSVAREWDGDYGTVDCGFDSYDTKVAETVALALALLEVVKEEQVSVTYGYGSPEDRRYKRDMGLLLDKAAERATGHVHDKRG